MSLKTELNSRFLEAGLEASRQPFNPELPRNIPYGIANPPPSTSGPLGYESPLFTIYAEPEVWREMSQSERQKLRHETDVANIRRSVNRFRENFGISDYESSVHHLILVASVFDSLTSDGAIGREIDEMKRLVEKTAMDLETVRLHYEAELAAGPLEAAFNAGFRLAFDPISSSQVLVKAMPGEDGYWVISSCVDFSNLSRLDAETWSVKVISYGADTERSTTVKELTTFHTVLDGYMKIELPAQSADPRNVIFESWADLEPAVNQPAF
jgi:hypothetical protein